MMRLVLEVIVKPRSSKESVRELGDGKLEVRVKAPPVDGKANERLIELIAEHFKVPKGNVSITSGKRSRRKLISVELPE